MRKLKIFMISFSVLFFVLKPNVLTAQEKMKPEEADAKIKELTSKVNDLKMKQEQLKKDIASLKARKPLLQTKLTTCGDEIYVMIGVTKEQVEAYAKKLDEIEKKINELSMLSNKDLFDRRAEIDEVQKGANDLKASKICLLPRFYERVNALQGKIDNLKPILVENEKTYTVRSWAKYGDCLWNISKKPTIYDNPFLWPKIWQDNRDKISDPDIIKEGWVLKIPPSEPLTQDETQAARTYWMKKEGLRERGRESLRAN